jgi:hypothetical protein
MNGRYRVTVLAVELYDPLLIQRAISRAGGDGARTGATLAIEVPGGFGPAVVAAVSSRDEASRLHASLLSAGIESIIVDDGHPLWNKLRRAWMRLEGRNPDAKTTAPEQRPPELPVDPLAPPGSEPDRVNFKLHRNADRADINPVDAVFGSLRVHLVRLFGLIVVILLFALPWYFMLGGLSRPESLKGGGGGEEVFRLTAGSGAQLPKVTLKGGPSDGSGGDPQREAEQMAAGAGSGDDGKAGPPGGQGAAGPSPIDEPNEAGGGNGPGGGKSGAPGSGDDPNALNDQLKRSALLLTIAGILGLLAGLVAGWLSFGRSKLGLRAVKSPWFWVAAAALVGGLALGHFATRQSELKKVAAKVQQEGSGSGSGSGNPAGSGSGAPTADGSDEAAGSGSGNSAPAPREGSGASPPKSIAAQVASMQGPPTPNLAALLRTLREKQAPAAKPSRSKASTGTGKGASDSGPQAQAGAGSQERAGGAGGTSKSGSNAGSSTAANAGTTALSRAAGETSNNTNNRSGNGTGKRSASSASDRAANPPQAGAEQPAAAATEGNTGAPSGTPSAPSAKAPKPGTVEARVASMGEPTCEQQRSPYKAMLCKLRKERTEAAAKAAEEAAAGKAGADPNKPGADKAGGKNAPGQPGGGKPKGNQPGAGKQQPPMGRGLLSGVGFAVGFVLGLLFSLFYFRFYRR